MRAFKSILILFLLSFLAFAQGQWAIVGHTPEVGGYGEAVLGLENSFLIVGQASTELKADVWLYSVQDGNVTLHRSLPPPPEHLKSGTALAYANGNIYVLIGGAYTDCNRTKFLRFSLEDYSWNYLAETPYPQGAGDALVYAEVEGKPYLYALLGASTKQRRCAISGFARYDLTTGEWSKPGELPKPWPCTDDGAALAWDGGNYIYALHGS